MDEFVVKRQGFVMVVNLENIYLLRKTGAFIFLLTAFLACYLLLKPGNTHMIVLVDHLLQVSLAGIAVLLALPFFLPRGEQNTQPLASGQTLQRWVPRLLILTLLGHATGFAIHVYNDLYFSHSNLSWLDPSWTDVACLSAHLLLLLTILLLL